MKKITVIGAPVWFGQAEFGTQLGPDAIRAAGLIDKLQPKCDVVDAGNLDIVNIEHECQMGDRICNIRNLEAVRDSVELLSLKTSEIVTNGRFPLALGGDHSIAIGTIAGLAKHYHSMGVIWFDAHADSNTDQTSPSGNIQGMPLAAGMGYGHPYLTGVGGYKNKIQAENIVLVGVRDMDIEEKEFIYSKRIKLFTSEDIYRIGIGNVMDEAAAYLKAKCDGIHLSYDLDVLDPGDSLGVGTPVVDGIGVADCMEALSILENYNIITSAEFVELNPLLDKDGRTVSAAVNLICALFMPK